MLTVTQARVELWHEGSPLGDFATDVEAINAASLHAAGLPVYADTAEYELRRGPMRCVILRPITGPDAPALGPVLTISTTELTVTLDRPATGPTQIATYELERYNGSAWVQIAAGPTIFDTGEGYSNTGLTASTSYSYRCRALDTTSRASEYSYSTGITSAGATNQAPVWQSGTIAISVAAGSSVDLSGYCSDPEGDQITFTLLDTNPNDGTIAVSGSGVLSTTSNTTVGANSVVVRASDGALTANKTIALTVTAASTGNTFYVTAGTATFNGATNGVQPGDTIVLLRGTGTRSTLKLVNVNGSSGSYVNIVPDPLGLVTIASASSFVLEFDTCTYVEMDGSGLSGVTYGIKVERSGSGVTSLVKCTNLCKFITIRYIEVDGNITTFNAASNPGTPIGMQLHHNTLSRVGALAGQFQEGRLVEYCYIHNVAGEGIYCGPNFNSTVLPMKNVVIRNNLIEDCGRDAIQCKSTWVGPRTVEDNTCRRIGRNQPDIEAGQRYGISCTGGPAIVRNNTIINMGESGIHFYVQNGPDDGTTYTGYGSYSQFEVEAYNNVVVNIGTGTGNALEGKGITVASDSASRVPLLPKIYSNTIVDCEGAGVSIGANEDVGFVRNNLLVNCGSAVSNGNGSTVSDNTSSSSPASLFVNYSVSNTYALSDFHLLAATAAAGGTAGTHYSTTDIEGTTRSTPDRGAYEYV